MPIELALSEADLQQVQECQVREQEQEAKALGQEVAVWGSVLVEHPPDRLAASVVIRVPAVEDRYSGYDA